MNCRHCEEEIGKDFMGYFHIRTRARECPEGYYTVATPADPYPYPGKSPVSPKQTHSEDKLELALQAAQRSARETLDHLAIVASELLVQAERAKGNE
jgi:hypothetical protein